MGSYNEERNASRWKFIEMIVTHIHLYSRDFFLLVLLFSILILIASFILYALCVRHHRRVSHTTNAIIISPLQPRTRSLGLDPSIINSLPIILHHNSVTSNGMANRESMEYSECCICLGIFEDEEKLKVLPECHHVYHSDCLDQWLSVHSSCPLCRASIQVNMHQTMASS